MYERVKEFAQWIAGLSVWYRLALSAALGTVGGSTVVGFLNNYAMYNYAYAYGSRIPVEGAPYLRLAVSLVSFAFLAASFLFAVLVYGLLGALSRFFRAFFTRVAERLPKLRREGRELSKGSKKFIHWLGLWASILTIISSLSGLVEKIGLLARLPLPSVSTVNLVAGVAVFVGVIALFSLWPWLVKWFAVVLTVAALLATTWAMFTAQTYASFLRFVKYGGGVPVALQYEDSTGQITEYSGFLFLITSNMYIMFDADERSFVEIPIQHVAQATFSLSSKYNLPAVKYRREAN